MSESFFLSRHSVIDISSLGDACCGCGACAARCPKGCITMEPNAEGFLHPQVDVHACVGCGLCNAVCPAQKDPAQDEVQQVIWARSNDTDVLMRSSSGGMFYLLACEVLKEGGAVCGAAWDKDFRSVRHVIIREEDELDSLMRSKYVQGSLPRELYQETRDLLCAGGRVLFSGTACQVAGMRAYLGELADAEGFLSIDVVCHGVPSPELWRRWCDYLCQAIKLDIAEVNFRSKECGWKHFSMRYEYQSNDGEKRRISSSMHRDDWYMRAFLNNASLRPSCFVCKSKRACGSDLTLGDYWGIDKEHPGIGADDCGVSAVLVNTQKGEVALAHLLDACEWGESSFDKVVAHNSALIKSVAPYPDRFRFMDAVARGESIAYLMKHWSFERTLLQRVASKLKKHKK